MKKIMLKNSALKIISMKDAEKKQTIRETTEKIGFPPKTTKTADDKSIILNNV